MQLPRRFLLVEDDPVGRDLLLRALRRKFTTSVIVECEDSDQAEIETRREKFDAIICHRAGPVLGVDTVRALRAVAPDTPIIMISGVDRSEEAAAAGATRFVHYDAWLMLGTLLEELLSKPASRAPWPA